MITSARNPKIQHIRALISRRQERERSGTFVVEGVRLLEEALQAGWEAELVLVTENLSERGRQVAAGFRESGVEVEEVPPELMHSLADTDTPQGILAVIRRRELPLPADPTFLLVVDRLRDPGNLGTILRTALSAGVEGVLLSPGTVDPFSPKVVRAGMGAHFRLPLRSAGAAGIAALCRGQARLLVSEVEGGTPLWRHDLRQPVALVIGGEADGASPEMRQAADDNIYIPMPGQAESLNAAVAAAILMFEVVRQRNS